MDNAYRRSLLTRTASASAAVGVAFYVVGQSVVDDMCKVVDIQSACRHVGGDEELCQMTAELLHRQVTLLLGEVAVERLGIVAVVDELVGYLLRLTLCATEYYRIDSGIIVDDALQRKVFVLGVDQIVDMVDVFGTLVP